MAWERRAKWQRPLLQVERNQVQHGIRFPSGRSAEQQYLKGSTSGEQANVRGSECSSQNMGYLTLNLHMLMFCPVGILRRNFKGLWEPSGNIKHPSSVLLSPNIPQSTGRSLACCGLGTNPLENPGQVAHNPIQKNHPTCVQYKSQPSRISEKKYPKSSRF